MRVVCCLQDFHITRQGKKLQREQCYGPQDLSMGTFIHVYGRDFFIHDADDFTKQWYAVSNPQALPVSCYKPGLLLCCSRLSDDCLTTMPFCFTCSCACVMFWNI